jgi:uncharacterized protein involved in cysteine biosynthesis
LSTLALEPSSGAEGGRLGSLARYADLVLLGIALPVFLLAGLPILAYLAIGAAWIVQRAIQHWAETRMTSVPGRFSALRLIAGSFIARLWLLTVAILVVGLLSDDETGLAAAVFAAALVTANLAGEALARLSAATREEAR